MAVTLPVQVRDRLLEAIRERGLQPGDQIPTEAEVSVLFGVSRSTVREALRLLERDGVIRTEHGRGRFLAPGGALRVERPIDRFESVTEDRKSTRLNSSHANISYAVFCLKKNKN